MDGGPYIHKGVPIYMGVGVTYISIGTGSPISCHIGDLGSPKRGVLKIFYNNGIAMEETMDSTSATASSATASSAPKVESLLT